MFMGILQFRASERVFVWASILNVNFVRASQQQKRKVDAFYRQKVWTK
jgi:hypothetical protein